MKEIYLPSEDLVEVPESVLRSEAERLNIDFNDIVDLPLLLCEKLCRLTFLSVNGNLLETLPLNIGSLTELTELYLKENCLVELPNSITELRNLQKLHLTGNRLQKFPEDLHLLERLTELVADENMMEHLPLNFGKLKSLSHLNLSYNMIDILPNNFGSLKNLKDLDLSNNCLKFLPDSFQYLPSLEVIDINNNKISSLPDKFSSARTLKKLLLTQNLISFIPAWFSDLENIKEIFLSNNALQEAPFPKDFGDRCNNLEQLDLSGNNVIDLPENFGKLKQLIYLDLGSSLDELERNRMIANGNDIMYLPITFSDLSNLAKLELDENRIRELPEDFGLLSNLTYIDLNHNLLKSLPESFGQLEQLKVCMLSMNYITHLPTSFGMLTAIEDLKLDNNLLEHFPRSLQNMKSLISLDLYNNCLKEPPEVVKEFKCLKHLDLRENDFGRTQEELLDITYEPTYPIRDPEFENTWRGRKRPDIQPSAWVEKNGVLQNKEHLDNDILYSAMASASALWRRHGQSDIRDKPLNKTPAVVSSNFSDNEVSDGYFSKISSSDESAYNQNAGCGDSNSCSPSKSGDLQISNSPCKDETEFWDDDLQSPSDCSSLSSHEISNPPLDNYSESEWESDSEACFPNNFSKVYKHPVENVSSEINSLFIPSDSLVSSVCAKEVCSQVVDGQFDDADS